MALPVAVQLYSIRDGVKADMKGTLKKVKEIGYTGTVWVVEQNQPSMRRAPLECVKLARDYLKLLGR